MFVMVTILITWLWRWGSDVMDGEEKNNGHHQRNKKTTQSHTQSEWGSWLGSADQPGPQSDQNTTRTTSELTAVTALDKEFVEDIFLCSYNNCLCVEGNSSNSQFSFFPPAGSSQTSAQRPSSSCSHSDGKMFRYHSYGLNSMQMSWSAPWRQKKVWFCTGNELKTFEGANVWSHRHCCSVSARARRRERSVVLWILVR